MRFFTTLSSALCALAVLGCTTCTDPEPEFECYSGVVVGNTCLDGVLIQVDAAYPIGQPISTDNNVIAAVNFQDLKGLDQVGQRIYFSYRPSPAQQGALRVCTANTVPLPVPYLVLSNISATNCTPNTTR